MKHPKLRITMRHSWTLTLCTPNKLEKQCVVSDHKWLHILIDLPQRVQVGQMPITEQSWSHTAVGGTTPNCILFGSCCWRNSLPDRLLLTDLSLLLSPSSGGDLRPNGVCAQLSGREQKISGCVSLQNDLILVDGIKMQRTPQNSLHRGLGQATVLGRYHSVCGWVRLQRTTDHRGGCQDGKVGCGWETEARNISVELWLYNMERLLCSFFLGKLKSKRHICLKSISPTHVSF